MLVLKLEQIAAKSSKVQGFFSNVLLENDKIRQGYDVKALK